MAEQKEHGISWTNRTWNPIRGCTRVSQGCVNCYAERVAHRFNKPGLAYEGLTDQHGRWNGVIKIVEDHMLDPLKWKHPQRVFVNSMSDLFHENVSEEVILNIFAVMHLAKQHSFQILTKRPQRALELLTKTFSEHIDVRTVIEGMAIKHAFARKMLSDPDNEWIPINNWPLPNVWLGVSVEDQKTADERIPLLLQTPAAVRWISAEPLLGRMEIGGWMRPAFTVAKRKALGLTAKEYKAAGGVLLDWVVVGGESGRGARPMEEAWARSLRDQCVAAGVAFHFKQWGEWLPAMCDGAPIHDGGAQPINCSDDPVRVGKHAAGRLLDGRTWDEYPEVRKP